MATTHLPSDFKEFLKLLNAHKVEYLLVGGYAVGYYGYPRATADMDIWIAINPENAERVVTILKEFGFKPAELSPELFLKEWQIIRKIRNSGRQIASSVHYVYRVLQDLRASS